MLKFISILLAVIVAVNCDVIEECISCEDEMPSILTVVQAVITGLQPIVVDDVSICSNLVITNITGLSVGEVACLITRPSTNISTQILDVQVATIHVECHIENDTIATNDSKSDVQTVIVDIKNITISVIIDVNFDEATANLTSIEIDQGNFDSTQLSLEGNTPLITVGKLFVNNSFTSNLLGYIVRFIASLFVDQIKDNASIVDIMSYLHCPEPE